MKVGRQMIERGPLALIIIDGWGQGTKGPEDAFNTAQTPYLDFLMEEWPWTTLAATGPDVGLPEGQIGNSEVGHLNLGAGRIVYQDLTRINKILKEDGFSANSVLLDNLLYLKERNGALHLLGLLSDGGVHSHINHLKELLTLSKENGLKEVFIHAILDGRDVLPQSASLFVEEIEAVGKQFQIGKIATIGGRYYYMDRDNRWDRTRQAYVAMVAGEGYRASTAQEAVEEGYRRGETDEFIRPTVITHGAGRIKAGDLILFYNFRADRARQLTRAFTENNFPHFPLLLTPSTIDFITMTEYDKNFDLPVLFPPQNIIDHLGEWLSKNGLRQLRLAETEKYAHVTFFFSGGREEQLPGEERCLVPSPKVATYDLWPAMSAAAITEKALDYLRAGHIDVYIINYANFDMVGHTGNYQAAVEAVEAVDRCMSKLVPEILKQDGVVILTSDHGNVEKLIDERGGPFTAHTINPVPFILCGSTAKKLREGGRLSDVAPTILEILGLEKPRAMDGESIIEGGCS